MNSGGDTHLSYALVCLRSGLVIADLGGDLSGEFDEIAAASPELFGTACSGAWESLLARFGQSEVGRFRELVLVSAGHVRVVERLEGRPDVALVALARGMSNVGYVLSALRQKKLELKGG